MYTGNRVTVQPSAKYKAGVMARYDRSRGIVPRQGRGPLSLRSNRHGSVKWMEAWALVHAGMHIPPEIPSLRAAGKLPNKVMAVPIYARQIRLL